MHDSSDRDSDPLARIRVPSRNPLNDLPNCICPWLTNEGLADESTNGWPLTAVEAALHAAIAVSK